MSTAMQIGLLAASVVFIILAVMAMYTLRRINAVAQDAERVIEMTQVQMDKMQEILASIDHVVDSVRGAEHVVHRATAITSKAIDEVEMPIRAVAATLHAVRTGAGSFLRSQFTRNGSPAYADAVGGDRDVTRGRDDVELPG